MNTWVRLRVTAGTGLLGRRERALLFVADRSGSALVDRFMTAPDGSTPSDPGSWLTAPGSPPFAFVDWSSETGEIRAIASTDLELSGDVEPASTSISPDPSVRTDEWAPHASGDVVLGVGGRCEPGTDLRDGVVPAGGFEFTVSFSHESVATDPTPMVSEASMEGWAEDWTEDWMEESLQLVASTTGPRPARTVETIETTLTGPPSNRDRSNESRSVVSSNRPIVELPDGTHLAIDRALVFGRRPDAGAARAPGAVAVALVAPSNVSRTHLVLSIRGTRLLATDCGSSCGTAVIRNGGTEPIRLDPWSPLDVAAGDQLYLGGTATRLAVHAPSEEPTR